MPGHGPCQFDSPLDRAANGGLENVRLPLPRAHELLQGRRGLPHGEWGVFSSACGSQEQPDAEDRERDASHDPSEMDAAARYPPVGVRFTALCGVGPPYALAVTMDQRPPEDDDATGSPGEAPPEPVTDARPAPLPWEHTVEAAPSVTLEPQDVDQRPRSPGPRPKTTLATSRARRG